MAGSLIAVDIGGTSVRVAIAPVDDIQVTSIKKLKQDTSKTDPGAISSQVIEMANTLLSRGNVALSDVQAISIATAGPIDMARGEVFNNANLGFKIIPLKEPVSAAFPGIPLHIINDCNGAVLGVHCFEATPDERDNLAYVTISTGIGGGVVSNGHLLLGKEGNAAEVGHGVLAPHSGVRCNCGAEGCWEAFSSGTGVAKHARDRISQDKTKGKAILDLAGGELARLSAKDVYAAARKGDALAKELVNQANYFNAMGIGLMNNFYDMTVVYLGGSMLKDEEQIIPPIREMFSSKSIEFTINKPPQLKRSRLGDEVGLMGALALGKYKIEKNPIIS